MYGYLIVFVVQIVLIGLVVLLSRLFRQKFGTLNPQSVYDLSETDSFESFTPGIKDYFGFKPILRNKQLREPFLPLFDAESLRSYSHPEERQFEDRDYNV